ncbi:MAG: hypothetical protein MJA30_06160 [Cytophagales bacterium]|nr:hypothetical protein [Cytophagales bacterium]
MKKTLLLLLGLLPLSCVFSQSPLPEADPISTYPVGMYYQRGPGALNITTGWTYPYGTKLTVHHTVARNFELMATNKNGPLAFRQFYDVTNAWTGWKTLLNSDENGNFGIGTTNPTTKLHVIGGIRSTEFIAVEKAGSYRVALNGMNDGYITGRDDASVTRFVINSKGASYFNGGNVLIGKTSQSNASYKLDIAGKVRANEIVVNTSGADYVFESGYDLRTLQEVQDFIDERGHLPGIPSAGEMQAKGMAVGELNTKLLEKVEELTLYVIELKRENNQHLELIKNLQSEITKLKN